MIEEPKIPSKFAKHASQYNEFGSKTRSYVTCNCCVLQG